MKPLRKEKKCAGGIIGYLKLFAAVGLTFIFLGTSGCDRLAFWKQDPVEVNDTVAEVGSEAIDADNLWWYLDSRSAGAGSALDAEVIRSRLQELAIVKLLAQEAIKQNLKQDSAVTYAIEQMLGQRLIDKNIVQPTMNRQVSSEEIAAYFNDHRAEYEQPSQVRLADIFIHAPEEEPAEEREKQKRRAEKILSDALEVQKERFGFARLVQQFSDQHPSYSLGDTGYFDGGGNPSGIDTEMVKIAFTLKEKGKVFDQLVATSSGFHVIMLVGKREATKTELATVSAQIEQRIRLEEIKRMREQLIESLVSKNSTKTVDEKLDKLVAQYIEENGNTMKKTIEGNTFETPSSK